jgi:hypothetical protein
MAFRDGKLIYASLGENSNGLAAVLHKSGVLTAEQRRVIHERARGTGDKQLGHLLIQAGFVTQSDIIQSVRYHILDVVYKMFTWADGLFRFDADRIPPPDRITVPIDLESVIMEGSRRMKEWDRLQEELPDLDVTLRFPSRPNARLQNVNLTVEEWRVVSYISPQNTLRQIADAVKLNDFQIRQIVYGMLEAGLVEFVEPPKLAAVQIDQAHDKGIEEGRKKPSVKRSVITKLIDRIRRL